MLVVIRCGQTMWDVERRLHGATDLPLSPTGRAILQDECGRAFVGRARTVHHPDDEAARESADLFARRVGAKTRAMADLGDPALGLLEGMTRQDFADRFGKRFKLWQDDPLSLTPPEGEDFAAARARVFSAIARLLKKSRGDDVAVVLHEMTLGMLRCWLADQPTTQIWNMLERRRHIERYAVPTAVVSQMEEVGAASISKSK